ncbi:MAG: TetR/AcrR family transcriptional regulator [Myxococcota bacterium]
MGRREDNKAKKRTDLEAAALRLFLGQGFHATTIEQIAAEAGVARGTFYLYFDDKETIFRTLVGAVLDPAVDALVDARKALDEAVDEDGTQAAYLVLAQALIDAVSQAPEATLLFYREQRNPGSVGDWLRSRGAQLDAFVADLLSSLMVRGLIRKTDDRFVALAILGAIDRLVYAWLCGHLPDDPWPVAREVVQLFGAALVNTDQEPVAPST